LHFGAAKGRALSRLEMESRVPSKPFDRKRDNALVDCWDRLGMKKPAGDCLRALLFSLEKS
jgi:hypothetical protein